jgi:hypothetical protein
MWQLSKPPGGLGFHRRGRSLGEREERGMQETRFPKEFLKKIDEVVSVRPDRNWAMRAAAVTIAMAYGEVNVDDMRECLESDGDARFFGNILAGMAKRGVLEKFGMQRTRRKTSHGRDIARFRLSADWERRWPVDELNPKSKITVAEDVNYVQERRVVA